MVPCGSEHFNPPKCNVKTNISECKKIPLTKNLFPLQKKKSIPGKI